MKSNGTKLDKKIGQAIEHNRKLKNKSRQWLGDKVGVCYNQIKHNEKGVNQITLNRLAEISKALKVKFSEFIPPELMTK